MAFDWIRFLDSRGIFYATRGANVAKGHIAVHCPMCGAADPSQHMSINLQGQGWKCWRNDEHRGKNPTRLVQGLLGCTWDVARSITGTSVSLPDDFMGNVMKHVTVEPAAQKTKLHLPREFKRIENKRSLKPFIDYLTSDERGFTLSETLRMTDDYGLRCALTGPQRYRVIFPVWYEGALVTWTGRTIVKDVLPRYKTLGTEEDHGPSAMGPITNYLLFYDLLKERPGKAIVLCEGPFDALKIMVKCEAERIDATCFTTAKPTAMQIELLHEILELYPRNKRFMILDRGTLPTALKLASEMSSLGVRMRETPPHVKDPGAMSRAQILRTVLS